MSQTLSVAVNHLVGLLHHLVVDDLLQAAEHLRDIEADPLNLSHDDSCTVLIILLDTCLLVLSPASFLTVRFTPVSKLHLSLQVVARLLSPSSILSQVLVIIKR